MKWSSARVTGLCAALALCGAVGCQNKPKPKPIAVTPVMIRDIHPLLKGTIGSEVEFRGIQPVLVSGLGLVVGLNGTGGDVLPDNVAATIEREMGLLGVGKTDSFEGTVLAGKSPRQLLRDPNIGVVIVQAAIAPGSPANSTFDVYVKALNATSLEGGTLWTTDLRLGEPAVFGAVQARAIAKAHGPVFINPFAERGSETADVTRTVGRVLGGGRVTEPFQIELSLDNASHARARAIVATINSRFPQGPGDPSETARGRNASSIALRVPRRYREEAAEFLQLVAHMPVDMSFAEAHAKRYVEGIKAEPALGEELSWCLEAVGSKALPFLRELYESPELVPRMAALRAGAALNDPRTAPHLKEIARTGVGGVRTRAIELLAKLDAGPSVDLTLRELLTEPELVTRVAAYEALAERAVRVQVARIAHYQETNPDAPRMSPTRMEVLAQEQFPRRSVQGVERRQIGNKFFLDIVPFGPPMIYVTQQGRPRIVLFGENLGLVRPAVASAWDERLIVAVDEGKDVVRVRYQNGAGRVSTGEAPANLVGLIEFLAREPTPEDPRPGLNLSYSDTVGVLSAVQTGGVTRAAFAREEDKLKAQILVAGSRSQPERPERPGEEPVVLNRPAVLMDPGEKPAEGPTIVPIAPPVKKKE